MIGNRIKQLIDQYELSYSDFAQQLGVQSSSISHLVLGRNKPSIDFIQKLHKQYPEVQMDWLLFGQGEPFNRENEKESNDSPTLFSAKEKAEKSEDRKEEIAISKDIETKTVKPDSKYSDTTNSISRDFTTFDKEQNEISDSQRIEKEVKSILIIYSDGSFEEFQSKKWT